MITIDILTTDPFYTLKDCNCITIGKRAGVFNKVPDTTTIELYAERRDYYKKCFLAEHSTIEVLEFRIVDDCARGDVINQIARATKGLPRFQVQSSRPDWNSGAKRKPSDETYVKFSSVWNPLSFMQMARQRLCTNAQKETREWVQQAINCMQNSNEPFFNALAECCMPMCRYRGNICYELKPCGKCERGII